MTESDPFIAELEKAGVKSVQDRVISRQYAGERLRKAEAWLAAEAEKIRSATQVKSLEVASSTRDAALASAESAKDSASSARTANDLARQANELATQAHRTAGKANMIAIVAAIIAIASTSVALIALFLHR